MTEPDTTTRLAQERITLRGGVEERHPRPDYEDADDAVTQALVDAAHSHASQADGLRRTAERARQQAEEAEGELRQHVEALRAITVEVARRREASAPIVVAAGAPLHARSVPPHLGLDPQRVGVGS